MTKNEPGGRSPGTYPPIAAGSRRYEDALVKAFSRCKGGPEFASLQSAKTFLWRNCNGFLPEGLCCWNTTPPGVAFMCACLRKHFKIVALGDVNGVREKTSAAAIATG